MDWARMGRVVLRATPKGHAWVSDHVRKFTSFHDNSPNRSDYERSRNRQIIWIWRLAGLLAITHGEAPWVSVDRFEQAVWLLDPETKSTESLMHTIEEGPSAEMYMKFENYIARKGGCVTHKDITNNFYRRDEGLK